MRMLCLLLATLLTAARPALARTLTVPGDHDTIGGAVAASASGDTVRVGAGVYSETLDIEHDLVLIGESAGTTVIEGDGAAPCIKYYNFTTGVVREFTLRNGGSGVESTHTNLTVEDCIIEGCYAGISAASHSHGELHRNRISGCSTGISIGSGTSLIANNIVYSNTVGIDCSKYGSKIVNNTVYGNTIFGVFCATIEESVIVGNIITGNKTGIWTAELCLPNLFVSYNTVWNNSTFDYGADPTVYEQDFDPDDYPPFSFEPSPGTGELHENPRFVAPEAGDFRLGHGSPCIDAGTIEGLPAVAFEADFSGGPRVLDGDRDGTVRPDMGALEYHHDAVPVEEGAPVPFTVEAPYPNPCNGGTTIRFTTVAPGEFSVRVYYVAGQAVRTLAVDRDYPAGAHALYWDCRDDSGRTVSTGVYLVRVVGLGGVAVRKAAFMK